MTGDPIPPQVVLKMIHVIDARANFGTTDVRSHIVSRTVDRPRFGSRTETLQCGFCGRTGTFVLQDEDGTERFRRGRARRGRMAAAGVLVVILACWGLGLFADIEGFLVAAIMATLILGPAVIALGLSTSKGYGDIGVESPAEITFAKREDWAGAGFRSRATAHEQGAGLSCRGSAQGA